jgi:hypothetical protein
MSYLASGFFTVLHYFICSIFHHIEIIMYFHFGVFFALKSRDYK